jgi:hypothetical protein
LFCWRLSYKNISLFSEANSEYFLLTLKTVFNESIFAYAIVKFNWDVYFSSLCHFYEKITVLLTTSNWSWTISVCCQVWFLYFRLSPETDSCRLCCRVVYTVFHVNPSEKYPWPFAKNTKSINLQNVSASSFVVQSNYYSNREREIKEHILSKFKLFNYRIDWL